MSTATSSNATIAKTCAQVVADMSVSLDGVVADTCDDAGKVFAWYARPQPATTPREPAAGEAESAELGVIVYGRRTFDVAHGWGGTHLTSSRQRRERARSVSPAAS